MSLIDHPQFLRRVLAADALSCLALGALLLLLAAPLAALFGLPQALLTACGAAALASAVIIGFTAWRGVQIVPLVLLVIVGNAGWVLASFAVLFRYWGAATPVGVGFVAVQAIATLVLAELEFIGLRRWQRQLA